LPSTSEDSVARAGRTAGGDTDGVLSLPSFAELARPYRRSCATFKSYTRPPSPGESDAARVRMHLHPTRGRGLIPRIGVESTQPHRRSATRLGMRRRAVTANWQGSGRRRLGL